MTYAGARRINSSLERGKRAEREVVKLVEEHLGLSVRRRLAGRTDDCGDLEGIPDWCIQIKSYQDITRAVNEALKELPGQQTVAGARWGAGFIRRPGGRYAVVMAPDTFFALVRETL